MVLRIGINFPKDPNILAVQTWRPASDRQAEGRIWRIHRKIHKKRSNQSEAYHNRIQKKWDKRTKKEADEERKRQCPEIRLFPHQQKFLNMLQDKKEHTTVLWPSQAGKGTLKNLYASGVKPA